MDEIILQNPDATGGEILDMFAAKYKGIERGTLFKFLRWPGVSEPRHHVEPQPQPQPMTELERDLRKHLEIAKSRTHRMTPSGPVSFGNPSQPGEKKD
jgi:hypothetical protein